MTVSNFTDLSTHVGHDIEVVTYGDQDDPRNVAVECVTCGTVLFEIDAYPDPYYGDDPDFDKVDMPF